MSAPLLPDPLSFVVEAVEARGALVERHDARAHAPLPNDVANELKLRDECTLALFPEGRDDVCVGLRAPLLERLITEARAIVPIARMRLDVEGPRPGHARALAERFVLRNGLVELVQVLSGAACCASAYVAWSAEADDRREGLLRVTVGGGGTVPDAALADALDLAWPSHSMRSAQDATAPSDAASWLARRADERVRVAVASMEDDVTRRHARDHARITEYFESLVREARAPRRKIEARAVEAKVGHLLAERDAKLRALPALFAHRVTSHLAAAVMAEVPVANVLPRLRRRKATRELVLRVPALAANVDRLARETCGAPTSRPAACDERLHLLCEHCAPNAQGRLACRACGAGR